jgi:nicotinamide-nucleotide amidase
MLAEVISIGDELTSGERLDTNTQWISQRLTELGIRTIVHTTVADDLAENVRVFQQAIERADFVISNGGLGPTADDLTRQAVADATGRKLILDAGALKSIEEMFSRRGRPMPERNKVQAEFPEGSRVITNPHGTAPGIDLEIQRAATSTPCQIFCLPGVPAELKEMWQLTVGPTLRKIVGPTRVTRHKVIKCFGLGESELESRLPDMIRRGRDPQVGITVHDATISLRISATGETEAECEEKITPTVQTINEFLGSIVFGKDNQELHDAVLELLGSRSQSLATAEWGTEGVIAHWLRSAPGNEVHYAGGAVIAGLHSAARFIHLMHNFASLSAEEITVRMAEQSRALFGTDYGLAVGAAPPANIGSENPITTPIAKVPFSATESVMNVMEKIKHPELPRIWFALATKERTLSISQPYVGHPALLVPRTAKQALNMLRLELLKR